MSETEKISNAVAEAVSKILEETKRSREQHNQSLEFEKEQKLNIEEKTKEEQLKSMYNQLSSNEIRLFKQLNEKEKEDLDNHFSDAGSSKHVQYEKYEEMKKLFSNESIKRVEDLHKNNISRGLNSPKNKIHMDSLNKIEKNMNEQSIINDSRLSNINNPMDAYEEALVIQENNGLSSNKVEWDNEKFLSHLKENNPEDYKLFNELKEVVENRNINEHTHDQNKKDEINLEKEIENHSKELNDFINDEVVDEKDKTTLLTKDELEGMLNDHFKRVEAALHDYENQNIDADTFKNKLQSLTNHVKNNARSQFSKVKNATVKPVKDLKRYAKNRINKFINSINDRLKRISASLDKKTDTQEKNYEKTNDVQQTNYETKIENALRNDPQLLKSAVAMTQMNEMRKHLEDSEKSLEKLNDMTSNDPTEQQKLNDLRNKMGSHINSMKQELNGMERSFDSQKTQQQINEKVEQEQENEPTQTTKHEEVMER